MEAAACCLPPHGLWVPVASARPAPGLEQGERSLPLWRPWLPRVEEGTGWQREQMDTAWTRAAAVAGDGSPDKALMFFHHPVRLLWPKSKCFDYLYGVGKKLLENFPVQATLCLYEDSGSEDSEDSDLDSEEEAAADTAAGPLLQAGSPGRPV